MGADFLCSSYAFKSVDWADPKYSTLDWEAGRARVEEIKNMPFEELEKYHDALDEAGFDFDGFDEEGGMEQVRESLYNALVESFENFKLAFEGEHREATMLWLSRILSMRETSEETPVWRDTPERLLITGGMSWGELPTDLFNAFALIDVFDIAEACGVVDGWIGGMRLYTVVYFDWKKTGEAFVIEVRAKTPGEAKEAAKEKLLQAEPERDLEQAQEIAIFEGTHQDLGGWAQVIQ